MSHSPRIVLRVACYAPLIVAACASGSRRGGVEPVPMRAPDAATRRVAERTAADAQFMGRLWTFEEPPVDAWKVAYDFAPDEWWLERVKLAAVRVGEYCSGAIVSPDGLVLTTHSCVRECITATSEGERDDLARGVIPRSLQGERQCPGLYIDQLVGARDVTSEVRPDDTTAADQEAERARIAEIERACGAETGRVCEVTQLWNGARLRLYQYHRHKNVKLAFAPELQVAHYGGAEADLAWPRHSLDFAVLRVYDSTGRAPARTPAHLVLRAAPPRDDEPMFVAGSPISTRRLATSAQLAYERDFRQPQNLLLLQGLAQILDAIDEDPEAMNLVRDDMYNVRGSLEITISQLRALQDSLIAGARLGWENHVRARIEAEPTLRSRYGDVWDRIAAIQETKARIGPRLNATNMQILGAPHLVYGADLRRYLRALAEPPDKRSLTSDYLEHIEEFLTGETLVSDALARRFLGVHVKIVQTWIAPDDPIRTSLIQPGEDPASAVERVADTTRLLDPAYRRALMVGGLAALAAAEDPLLRHAILLDSLNEELAAIWRVLTEEEQHQRRRLGEAVLATFDSPVASDATFTPRLADGTVRSYLQNDVPVPAYTTFYGLYERAQVFADDPALALPESFQRRRQEVDLSTPLDFIITADAFPSGGAVVDRAGMLTGILIGTNREHLANSFVFLGGDGRAIAVHSAAVIEVMASVYRVDRIVRAIQIRKEKP